MADIPTPWRALLVIFLIAIAILVFGYVFDWPLPEWMQ